jgi:prolyl-tRNA synthetase
MGIGAITYPTFASGGPFSKYSHEFQTISDAGEDTIYVSKENHIAVNGEVYTDEVLEDLKLTKDTLQKHSAIEVGNIFKLGTRFSSALGLTYKDESGKEKEVVMGCYGIGPTRLMGTVVEALADQKGIVWPSEIAPFGVHLVALSNGNEEVSKEAERIYAELSERGVTVLFDDRDVRAGEKFADSDLIGIPKRLVISEKTINEGGIEIIDRATGTVQLKPERTLIEDLAGEK